MNTFEAPPRTLRVADLPPPFTPSLPATPKRPSVASVANVATLMPQLAPVAPRVPSPARPPVAASPFARSAADSTTAVRAVQPKRRIDMNALKRRFAMLLVTLLVAGGGVYAYQHWFITGPPHPDSWDPRVVPIVRFVERERGLTFDHAIYVDFLTDADYQTAVRGDASSGTDTTEALAAASDANDLFNAFGLVGTTNVARAEAAISAAATIGFYTPATDRIAIRGNKLTPAVRVVLAHELTHALQAQHFDLEGLDGSGVVRSVAEADAMRIEDRYLNGLLPEDRAAAMADNTISAKALRALATVPWTLTALRMAPYELGPALVNMVYDQRGNDGVNLLFHTVPSEAQLLSPWKWSPGIDATPTQVDARAPERTVEAGASAPMSRLQLLVMFDAWLPWSMARGALDSLSGAAFVPYRTTADGPLCAAVSAQFTTDPHRFADAVTWWAGASGSTARPTVSGNTVSFDACPRGRTAPTPPKPTVSTTTALLVENAAIPHTVRDAAAATPFLCAARQLVDDPSGARVLSNAHRSAAEKDAIDAFMAKARRGCGG